MSNRPPQPPQRPLTKRQVAESQREANAQRRVMLTLIGVFALALLLIVAGVVYDRIVIPGRTIRSVNSQTLSRADYDTIVRNATLQNMIQNLQFSKILGPNQSFGQDGKTFSDQIVEANISLATLGTSRGRRDPVSDQQVATWTDQVIAAQKAKQELQIDPQIGEINQQIVAQYGGLLATATPAVSDTNVVSGTAALGTPGASAVPAASAGPATTASAAALAPTTALTPTVAPSPTPGPSPTGTATPMPTASPVADEAAKKAEQIADVLLNEYDNLIKALPEGSSRDARTTHATKDDFLTALREQARLQLIEQQVKDKLPTDDTAAPERITARHILLKVPQPKATPSPTPTAAAGAATPTATATGALTPTATITPVPSPTFTADQLEKAFADRLVEAQQIYAEVSKNPETFAEVAKAKSEDEGSAVKGGDLGEFGKGQMVKPFEDAAFALKENEISQPVRSDFGWHIIQRMPEDPEAKKTRLQTAAYDKWLSDARAQATIVPAPTATPTMPPTPTLEPEPAATLMPAESAAPAATVTAAP